MLKTIRLSGYQFAFFRVIFGLYLTGHIATLIPYGAEIFSQRGVLPDPSLSPLHGVFPNVLALWDAPPAITLFLSAMVGLSLLFTLGVARRAVAIGLWYGWACLYNRNPLISNPSVAYVGVGLLLTTLIPATEPLRLSRQRAGAPFYFPAMVYAVAWVLMAAGYTYSGLVKLSSPSWVDGTAMMHLVNNPLARPGFVRDLFLAQPEWVTAAATWFSLAGEILFLPLSCHRRGRLVAWLWLIAMHLGILCMVDFMDLTVGMLMIHLFTFDPAWLPARKRNIVVLFDGVCGLCDRTIQTFMDEDATGILRYSPLQGETAARVKERHRAALDGADSVVAVENIGLAQEKVFLRSAAVLTVLDQLGGFWRVVSWLRVIPAGIRDAAYNAIAKRRYAWFGKFDACRRPTPETAARFLP